MGNRWHFAGTVIALVLALGSPFVLVYKPTLGPTLGAAAGIWIFLARILFEPIKERYQTRAPLPKSYSIAMFWVLPGMTL